MNIFGGLDVRLDAWAADYGSGLLLRDEEPDEGARADPSVEHAVARWEALEPGPGALEFARVAFVDGVRRVDRHVQWRAQDDGAPRPGLFGSFAVGAVLADKGGVGFGPEAAFRRLVLGAGRGLPDAIAAGPGLVYAPIATEDDSPDAPLRRLQVEMRTEEQRLARRLAEAADTLVVADGPLTFGDRVRGAALGLAKRVSSLYLEGPALALLPRLRPGTRTPLFHLTRPPGFARYSWFLRLAEALPYESELSGLVRLEVADCVGLESARRLADGASRLLPRYASRRGRDPRAPQNLIPVGALEQRLRGLLGDPALVERRIRDLIAHEVRRAHA